VDLTGLVVAELSTATHCGQVRASCAHWRLFLYRGETARGITLDHRPTRLAQDYRPEG
jgi:hypothetical protein